MNVTEQIKIVHEMMKNMNAADRELMSDKLLSYLLFDSEKSFALNTKTGKSKNKIAKKDLTAEELKLIKELAKKTEDLRNLLGDDPQLFS